MVNMLKDAPCSTSTQPCISKFISFLRRHMQQKRNKRFNTLVGDLLKYRANTFLGHNEEQRRLIKQTSIALEREWHLSGDLSCPQFPVHASW